MGFVNEQLAIEGKFIGWNACRIKYANRPFNEPSNAPYIALHILNGEGYEASIGSPAQRRHVGVVAVQIFDLTNAGDATVRQLSDQLELLFINANSRLTISPTEYLDFDQPSLSASQDIEGRYQRNLTISYTRDEYR